jgi:rhomboid family GlyGly-CTERM serine protease
MMTLSKSLNCDGRNGVALAFAALLLLALALSGDSVRDALSYDRQALLGGQWWRLATGHFVHLDRAHAVLNVVGLALVWALFLRAWPPAAWLAIALVSIAAIDAGLWFLQPRVQWYVGASGLLHGLLVAGLVAQLAGESRAERRIAAIVLGALALKLAWEQARGALPFTTSDQTVILPAHLYGAVGGFLASVALVAIMRRLLHRAG